MKKVIAILAVLAMAGVMSSPAAAASYFEDFNSIAGPYPAQASTLPGWSNVGRVEPTADIDGSVALGDDGADFTFADLDLTGGAGLDLRPSASDPFWEVSMDAYLLAGTTNQGFSLHGNPGADRWMEVTWRSGNYQLRIWPSGSGTTSFDTGLPGSAGPLGDVDGLRTLTFRLDASGATATVEAASGTPLTIGPVAFDPANYPDVTQLSWFLEGPNMGRYDNVLINTPEPSGLLLFGLGLAGLGFCGRRRRRHA